SDDDMGFGLFD
nr:Chain C, ACIDIC RIBOSOMAL PROTEIN P2 [Homo sapiens]2JDL_D Chain D, ACIDIC RIBOSOMAL PROTEIN P2 [Homo sapiens]